MSELFLSTIGELQRDAGPISINNEEVIRSSTSYDPASRSKGFAHELVQASMNLTLLISKLPTPLGTEQDQLARIKDLQSRNFELEKELESEFQVSLCLYPSPAEKLLPLTPSLQCIVWPCPFEEASQDQGLSQYT
jgi:hypothetical protein